MTVRGLQLADGSGGAVESGEVLVAGAEQRAKSGHEFVVGGNGRQPGVVPGARGGGRGASAWPWSRARSASSAAKTACLAARFACGGALPA